MAITTLDGVIGGSAPHVFGAKHFQRATTIGPTTLTQLISTWTCLGMPGPGSVGSGLTGNALTNPTPGQIAFTDPTGGQTAYISRFAVLQQTAGGGIAYVADRLWHSSALANSTSSQAINSVTWPARDNNGSTNGDGVVVGVEVTVPTSGSTVFAGSGTATLTYTNAAGTSGRTATATMTTGANGFLMFFPWTGTDTGVRSIQSFQFSNAAVQGAAYLIAYRLLAAVEVPSITHPGSFDPFTGGMAPVFAGSVPFFLASALTSGATNANIPAFEVGFTYG